jgi:hypothetical protein
MGMAGMGFVMPLGHKDMWTMDIYGKRAHISYDLNSLDGHTQMGITFRRYLDLSR